MSVVFLLPENTTTPDKQSGVFLLYGEIRPIAIRRIKQSEDFKNGKACKEDKSAAYTEFVRERAKEVWENGFVDINFLSEAVSGIKIYKDGRIAVEFVNGAEVSGKEAKSDAAEDSDEDRSESFVGQGA